VVSLLDGKSLTYRLDKIKVQLATYRAFRLGARIIINQGGTRSTKTYSVVKLLIGLALWLKLQISITSLSLPHLKKGALKDWKEVMNNNNLYDQNAHRRTDRAYDYPSGSYIEFFSVDDSLKVRGPGRDILFVNELNLIDFDTFIQLLLRTKICAIGDFNPADEFHWIYDELLAEEVLKDGDITWYRRKGVDRSEKPDVAFIKSTYLDNPFLPHEQVKEIENLKNVDSNFWRIYGEGERGHSEGVIYTHWQTIHTLPQGNVAFGLDFGYNNPTSLVKVIERDQELHWSEEIYQSGLTNNDLIPMVKQFVKSHEPVMCDSAEPSRIEELRRAGIKALPANKDVKLGIDFVKSRKLYIHSGSVNLLKEIKSYKYMDQGKKKGNEPEVPLKLNDHAMDAARYGSMAFKKAKVGLHLSWHK
jgi:phage terminase large subunit